MAAITKIDAYVYTADVANAGTNGWVYLGIAGREFHLDSTEDDFEQGKVFTYTLGDGANVKDPAYNDPRSPQLDTDDLDRYPAYLRFEPAGSDPAWCLERVIVTVNPGSQTPHRFDNPRLVGSSDNQRIWLDQQYGKQVGLKRFDG
ncbi:hypothetical protein HUT18_25615 [Streptomyces sp. NA04227]|uniref:hypothetical protein n=1 Tax=Streptomyces sp. NA04227 TaxID=2742136 RepID=UPI0015915410|nr:hypothetical protein [Streptomyces sp. NA04227]QKW09257.1 hypothetical protein HUT18_25615 [Streptomyces sp. NA04227]